MPDIPEEARKKVIEIIENSLLCETKERDVELATQIADDVIPIITRQVRWIAIMHQISVAIAKAQRDLTSSEKDKELKREYTIGHEDGEAKGYLIGFNKGLKEKDAEHKKVVEEIESEGWELQDRLLAMTVLNQNAPKIVLTNDECGWNISYYPDPPSIEGEISVMKGDPLEVVRALGQILNDKAHYLDTTKGEGGGDD